MRSKATPRVLMSARRSPNSKGFTIASAAPVNARAAKAPAVGQADAGSELPRYFLRSHARQLLQGQHLAEKRKLEARESSSGKRRRLESPPEQAKPAEDPEAASPGQRRSQGPPHGRPSSRWCGSRHCSSESSVQDSPPAPVNAQADSEPPRYFLRSHARQVSHEHVAEKRKLEARGKSSGKRCLWSPPEQAQPTEDPASASPGQHCSQGLPHGRPSSRWCGSRHCSSESSVQDSPPAPVNAQADSEPPRYFLRSHARQVSHEHVAEKRKLEARGKSSGKRCLWSPPEQAQPTEDPASASPGQHCSQGLPHGRPSSRWCGSRHCSSESSVQDSPPAPVNAQADSEPPRYFLRSHARQVSHEHVAEKRKLEARGKSSGKRCLWSPPEQAQPTEDPASASPGQHCSQGLPHGRPSSRWCGSRHCSSESSVQDSPPAPVNAQADSEPPRYFLRSHARQVSHEHVAEKRKLEARGKSSGKRCLWSPPEQAQPTEDPASASPGQHCSQGLPHGRPSSRWCGRRLYSPESSVQDSPSPSRRQRRDALAWRLWREKLARLRKRLAVFGPRPSSGMLSSACSTTAPAVGLSGSSGGENSSGKRGRLESPPEQAKPAEDPEAASPGQRRSQGPPHDTNGLLGPSLSTTGGSSPSCSLGYEGAPVPQGYLGRRPSHIGDQAGPSGCSRFLRRTPPHQAVSELDEASRATLQEELSPTLSCRKLAATDTRGRPSSRWCGRRLYSPESSVQDSPSPSRRQRRDALAWRLWREKLARLRKRLAVFGPRPSSGMLSSACSTTAPAVGLSGSSGGENSSGKRGRLESPPEQAKPAEDPEAASPGQRRSQGPPHDTNGLLGPSLSTTGGSSPSCSLGYEGAPVPQGYLGRRPSHIGDQAGPSGCSRFLRRTPPHQAVSELDEASRATLQEELSPTLSCRKLAATDTRGRPSSRWCGRRLYSPESSVQDSPSPSRRQRRDALAWRLWREKLARLRKRLAVFGPRPSSGMLSSACSTTAPAVGLSGSSGGENSSGKRGRLESPPEQAKPAEDPEAASPGQRRSQGPPHDTNGLLGPSLSTTGGSSPSCSLGYEGAPVPQGYLGRRPSHIGDQAGPSECSRFLRRTPPHQAVSELDEASRATLQEELSPTLSCRKLAATDTRVSAGLSPTFTLLPGMDTKMRLRERGLQPRQLKESSTQTLSAGLSPTFTLLPGMDTKMRLRELSAGLSPTFTLLPGMDTKMRLRERGLQRHEVKDSSTQTWFDCPLGKSFKPAGSAAMMRLLEQPLVREEDVIFTKMPTEDGHGETGVTFGHYF
ncbi:uncharacterized protein LOC142790041 isoform X3 [Rhipicephalus microplus]|uniref:uncharacterized protein LOC142790041 isoform X3 n=1 Tax=Rhipicephalus microplus TaxID=6941 RepID=UPI003F6B9873